MIFFSNFLYQAFIPGAIVGVIFGFLLQKGNVANSDTIIGQLLLRNFTVMKIIISAIAFGSWFLYRAYERGFITSLPVKQLPCFSHLIGGLIFGIGMALLGYCPGTCLAAAGQRTKDAWWGILGMLTGAFLYILFYPLIKKTLVVLPTFKTLFLSDLLHVKPLSLVLIFLLGAYALQKWVKK